MDKTDKPLLKTLSGFPVQRRPIWLMRQAGRYLPEYHSVKAKAKNFLDLCLTPTLASEVSLQPIRRFGFDGAIVFADILLVPYGLGMKLEFVEGKGPRLSDLSGLHQLAWSSSAVEPVFETLTLMKDQLPTEVTRIGFSGGPWTVAGYMVPAIHEVIRQQPVFLKELFDILLPATLDYLDRQIKAGAEVIQIFESAAWQLEGRAFREWIVAPTQELVCALKARHPSVPIIGFPRGATLADYDLFARQSGVDALGLDPKVPLVFARDTFQKHLQGNLDPLLLRQGGVAMQKAVAAILETLPPPHVMNLGHGVLPDTPIENIEALVKQVRE